MARRRLPPGPYRTIDLGNGRTAPLYLMPFTKKGASKAPKTRAHLIESARIGGFTHVFIFSHGWNSDFTTATKRYGEFIELFSQARQAQGVEADYKPLLVGIIWPSSILVMPWEKGPKMAAATAAVTEAAVEESFDELDEVAELLPGDQVEKFYDLAQRDSLGDDEARELASLLLPLFQAPEDPAPDAMEALSVDSLVAAGNAVASAAPEDDEDDEDFGFAGESEDAPQAAGLSKLDPRNLVRVFTAWKMKDRAGVVGARGVGPLLRELIPVGLKIHLIGHSYGAKVLMSALAAKPDLERDKVESVLLLQPAVNGYCFAEQVPGEDSSGAYRRALDAVRQPIMTTFSKHDFPLTKFFHLAMRRDGDAGEHQPMIAAATAPSRFAALGGFGPQGCPPPECEEIEMRASGVDYPGFGSETEIWSLRSHETIDGHGGVVNPATIWALLAQVRRSFA